MNWICERKLTEDDCRTLNLSAQRFINRHNLQDKIAFSSFTDSYFGSVWSMLEDVLLYLKNCSYYDAEYYKYLYQLWIKCFRRAVKSKDATGIGWGYIGKPEKN